jgi:hypothetical protein
MQFEEVKRSFTWALTEASSYISFISTLDDTRYCRWSGQTYDGRKWSSNVGKEVFPWEGASDIRPYIIDDLVIDDVDIMRMADRNCHMQTLGTNSQFDQQARETTSVLDWVNRNMLAEEMEREKELAAQWRQHYGSSVMGIDWYLDFDSEVVTVTLQQLMQMAMMDPMLGAFLEYLMRNMQKGLSQADLGQAAQMFKMYFPEVDAPAQTPESQLDPSTRGVRPPPKPTRYTQDTTVQNSSQALQSLMRTGSFSYHRPYIKENRPTVTAYRTYQDIFFFRNTYDLQRLPWLVRRDVIPKDAVMDRARYENWDPQYESEILERAGSTALLNLGLQTLFRFRDRLYVDEMKELCEVYYAFHRGTDPKNRRETLVTIFHPNFDLIGRQLPLPYLHGKYPFVLCERETRSRSALESRGIGDIGMTGQAEIKLQKDSRNDRTALCTLPPLQVPLGRGKQQYKLGPRAQLGVMRPGELSWLPPPPLDNTTYQTEQSIRQDLYNYFGKSIEGVDPNKVLRKQQRLVDKWLAELRQVHIQIYQLCMQYLPDDIWATAAGDPAAIPQRDRQSIQRNLNLTLEYDSKDLNQEYVLQKLQLIQQMLVATDAAGVIDRAGLTMYAARALDPALARQLIQPQQQVTQAEINDEQDQLSKIADGIEPPMYTGGQNAQLRLQVIQNTMQQPGYINALRQNPISMELLQRRQQNLQQQVVQQQNAVTGKLGVPPGATQQLQGAPGPAPAPQLPQSQLMGGGTYGQAGGGG